MHEAPRRTAQDAARLQVEADRLEEVVDLKGWCANGGVDERPLSERSAEEILVEITTLLNRLTAIAFTCDQELVEA